MVNSEGKKIGSNNRIALRMACKGIVQGVGFRPFVYNLAKNLGIKGWVLNSTRGLEIHAEGPPDRVEEFVFRLKTNPPRLAKITSFHAEPVESCNFEDFRIKVSERDKENDVLVPPDTAICGDCRREIFDPQSRYYLYPFTNCTNCGPRFTIVKDFPYDRINTTMSSFKMCARCREEYSDPGNRRFHAQPTACPACGPSVQLTDNRGQVIPGNWRERFAEAVKSGAIIAVKGIGGFHLACDALNPDAVARLRERKSRPYKPLAVMARDMGVVEKYCTVNKREKELLSGPEAPIVVLNKIPGTSLPENLSPNIRTLGVMLPYTPLHLLLFDEGLELLVMTSGNPKGLPLEKDNREALERLGGVADYFLMHNRDIENRTDDSVVRIVDRKIYFFRRSRGYVPRPINVPVDTACSKTVLGIGGEMKNTFCILKPGGEAYPSQHMGELETVEAMDNLRDSLDKFRRFLEVKPEIVGYDMHPQYYSSLFAKRLYAEAKYAVQHHHAHMASCMAENKVTSPVIGVILDGTGYGTDGKIWGCEFLVGDYLNFTRHAHLKYIPLIGGERAVNNPWLVSLVYLREYLEEEGIELARKFFGRDREIDIALKMLDKGFNCPLASSAGRLFDAVSAFLAVCEKATYEGQPAIELGELAGEGITEASYGSMLMVRSQEPILLDPGNIIKGIARDRKNGVAIEEISTKFHNSFVETIVDTVKEISSRTGIRQVVLSGGVFHNEYLLYRSKAVLENAGYRVFTHSQVPPSDGGICLGQAVVAYWRWHRDVPVNTGKSYQC